MTLRTCRIADDAVWDFASLLGDDQRIARLAADNKTPEEGAPREFCYCRTGRYTDQDETLGFSGRDA
jgi:hypothetical protein